MSPEEIIQAYDVLAQDVRNAAAEKAAAVGNSQRSLGTMAERVASPSGQTSGLANYTYNRLMRPIVDTTTATLTTQGKAEALEKYLSDALMAAKNEYEDSKNRYTVASTTPTTQNQNQNQYTEDDVKDATVSGIYQTIIPYGTINGVEYMWDPETKHVVINGQELNMTPEQYAAQHTPGGGGGGGGW